MEAPHAGAVPEGRLFPHFVCRVAGLPGDSLVELRADATLEAFDRLLSLESDLKEQATPLTDELFAAIDGQDNVSIRRALLRLKRDIHNLRPSPDRFLETATPVLSDACLEGLRTFRETMTQHAETWDRFRRDYADELVEIRRRFQDLVTAETFRHGLLMSSRSLSDQVARYRRASPQKPGSKARQVERSLMRYLSRTVMKATPFSTLCSLLPGEINPATTSPTFDGAASFQRSQIRLNKSIYARLLGQILPQPGIRKHLCVELNPTLERDVTKESSSGQPPWVFLSAQGPSEVFHRLAHPVVDLIQQWLGEHGPRPLGELLEALAGHADIDASPDQAEAFVEQLLKIGLLRFRLGIREQEVHWDAPLRQLMEGIDDPMARGVQRFLVDLRTLVEGYETADLEQRRDKLVKGHALLRSFFDEIGAPPPGPSFEVFYEDAGGNATLRLDAGPLEDSLVDYIRWTSRLAWPRGEQANMRSFFDRFYDDAEPRIPLLRFYEDYFREHFKEHLAQGQRPPTADPRGDGNADGDGKADDGVEEVPPYDPSNPFDLDYVRQLDGAVKGMNELLQERWMDDPEADVIHLDGDDFRQVLGHLPESNEPVRSATLFVQYLDRFAADGSPALVARSYLAGYGKYFSRFLYLLPEQVQRDLLDHNHQRTDEMLAEICGDANFNANLHPPLVPWELSYPTGESGAADEQIRTSEVDVEVDPESPHRLRLRHRSQDKVVIPVDLGFLNPRMRPPLFQLLTRFAPADNFTMMIPELPKDGVAPPPVLYRPRIVYRNHLILARRQWRIAGEIFPSAGGDPAVDYFERMQRWRVGIGLPEEVFVRIHVQGTKIPDKVEPAKGEGAAPKGPRGVREHLYKPQYIDFANPLLVDLLGRGAENLSRFYVVFEECLPSRKHFLKDDDHSFATELILQVDMAPAEGDGGSDQGGKG